MQTVRRVPVTLVRGEGSTVWDDEGRSYLDFVGGWATATLGHSHPGLADAIAEQARTLIQVSNAFYTVPQVELAQLLIDNSCMDRVFFCNSGAEAVEGAIKVARRYGKLQRDGAYEVITALDSFHGRTLATVAATGQPHYQEGFTPLTPGFVHVPFDSIDAIVEATNERTAAVLLEPVQGEGGVNVPSPHYLRQVREWCDANNLLLMFDEVQTGVGRLGSPIRLPGLRRRTGRHVACEGSRRRGPDRRVPRQRPGGLVDLRRPRLDLRRQPAGVRSGAGGHADSAGRGHPGQGAGGGRTPPLPAAGNGRPPETRSWTSGAWACSTRSSSAAKSPGTCSPRASNVDSW